MGSPGIRTQGFGRPHVLLLEAAATGLAILTRFLRPDARRDEKTFAAARSLCQVYPPMAKAGCSQPLATRCLRSGGKKKLNIK